MYSWENPDDRVAIVNLNSELRHAQLELLSAHCATHQLRLRFSADDLARFGQRDVLRKSVQAASALSEYYTSLVKKIPSAEAVSEPLTQLSEDRILEAVDLVSCFLREQRERYFHSAAPLTRHHKALLWPYFSSALLERVKIVELDGSRVSNPPFYDEARALGFANLPDVTHMHALTFLDVVVFNERITERTLFHASCTPSSLTCWGLSATPICSCAASLKPNFIFRCPSKPTRFRSNQGS